MSNIKNKKCNWLYEREVDTGRSRHRDCSHKEDNFCRSWDLSQPAKEHQWQEEDLRLNLGQGQANYQCFHQFGTEASVASNQEHIQAVLKTWDWGGSATLEKYQCNDSFFINSLLIWLIGANLKEQPDIDTWIWKSQAISAKDQWKISLFSQIDAAWTVNKCQYNFQPIHVVVM